MDRQEIFSWGKKKLERVTQYAYLETLTLLSFVLKISQTNLLSHFELPVPNVQQRQFRALIKRRSQKEPIPYLTGECEFWSLPFIVTPQCLIPRSETELLIEKVLAYYSSDEIIRIIDLGTGSGVIAIALALARPHWKIIATDQSAAALQIAKSNAQRLGASLQFRQGSWFTVLSTQESFHAILSNPPYLREHDPHLNGSIQYEPKQALIAGQQGTEALHHLIQHAPSHLTLGGLLWLEHGFDQASIVQSYLQQYGYSNIQQYYDITGILRVSNGRFLN